MFPGRRIKSSPAHETKTNGCSKSLIVFSDLALWFFFFFCFSFCNIVDNGRLSMQREHPVVATGTWPTHLSPLSLSLFFDVSLLHLKVWIPLIVHGIAFWLSALLIRQEKKEIMALLRWGGWKGELGDWYFELGFSEMCKLFPSLARIFTPEMLPQEVNRTVAIARLPEGKGQGKRIWYI